MVQIIPTSPRNLQRQEDMRQLGQNISGGVQGFVQGIQGRQQREKQNLQTKAENDAIRKLTGMDPSGIQDPKMRQEILAQAMQGQREQQNYQQKQGGSFARQILGLAPSQDFTSMAGGLGAGKPQDMVGGVGPSRPQQFAAGMGPSQPNQMVGGAGTQNQSPMSFLESQPESKLRQLAALSGQPGEDGIIGNAAKQILDQKEADAKLKREETEKSPEYARERELAVLGAKEDSKYYSDLNEKRSKQIFKKESLYRIENMIKKGASGKAYEKALENIGLISRTSDGRRELAAEVKNQYTDFKAIAGSQLSAQEFFTLTNAYPNPDFSPEANQAIVNNLKEVHDLSDKEHEIASRIKKENNGKIPSSAQERVNNELQYYSNKKIEKVKENIRLIMKEEYGIPKGFELMFDNNGDPLSVPENEVTKLLDDGMAYLP